MFLSFYSTLPQVKRQLVQNILKDDSSSSPEILNSLGSAVSVLPLSKLSRFTPEELNNTLTSLSQVNWSPAQAKTLAKKLLESAKVSFSTYRAEFCFLITNLLFHKNVFFCRI